MKNLLKTFNRIARGYLKDQWEPIPELLAEETLRLGTSHEGRRIGAYRINSGAKKVLFVAAIHGNEVGTRRTLVHLYAWIKDHSEEFIDFTFWFVPCLNPDGFAQALAHPDYAHGGRKGRFNGKGVDLNRNFPVSSFKKESHWNHGKNYRERTPVFCGEQGGSEPETKALTQFALEQKIEVLFMLHNVGEDVMPSLDARAQKLAKIFSKQSGFSFVSNEEWVALEQTGTFKEWCELHKIAFLEVEASVRAGRYGSDWVRQKPAFLACLEKLKQES